MPEGSCAVVNAIDVLARLPARRINWARDVDSGIEDHHKQCWHLEEGTPMNCCVPDEDCRELNQPKEKDAIWKFSEVCELYASETKTLNRAAFLARRASNSGAC